MTYAKCAGWQHHKQGEDRSAVKQKSHLLSVAVNPPVTVISEAGALLLFHLKPVRFCMDFRKN